ncbi:MAG TPA: hypothetical protein VG937_32370, partial [Polyangiaceae bacterium]|nr:hypothetical protein [Polyangiaceae bacterium]
PQDGRAVLELIERVSKSPNPPSRYYFDLGRMTSFDLGYADVVEQAKRTMRLRFPGRVVFAIYSTSSVTRGFATVFSKFIDATKLKVIVSDDPTMIERQLR